MSERFRKSEELLERALKTIPLGTQTFSKSKTQYPYGVSPYYLVRGKGSHVWDPDGNEYVDFINSLGAITLGYSDPDVTAAVNAQLENGVIFSLPHPLEIEVAEKIVEMVPCAEMVRFGKNGSDATSGAIRLARAYTGRDHVAVCGYHGWQDWYIGSTSRHKGVPAATCSMTHSFKYNDIESLCVLFESWPDQIAAVIMEPMNSMEPQDCFLEKVRDICKKRGAVFILDETITGFRFAKGGAQEYFNVIPVSCNVRKRTREWISGICDSRKSGYHAPDGGSFLLLHFWGRGSFTCGISRNINQTAEPTGDRDIEAARTKSAEWA